MNHQLFLSKLSIFWHSSLLISTMLLFVLLPPATKLGQGYIFTGVCHSVKRGGVLSPRAGGGVAWCFFLGGVGFLGMCGFFGGVGGMVFWGA